MPPDPIVFKFKIPSYLNFLVLRHILHLCYIYGKIAKSLRLQFRKLYRSRILHYHLLLPALIVEAELCLQPLAVIIRKYIPRVFYYKLSLFKEGNEQFIHSKFAASCVPCANLEKS